MWAAENDGSAGKGDLLDNPGSLEPRYEGTNLVEVLKRGRYTLLVMKNFYLVSRRYAPVPLEEASHCMRVFGPAQEILT